MTSPTTFPDALADELRRDPARPAVTFYDDATGERVELSVTTYANWVAKTAGLLQDELDAERGGRVLVDLPTHWLGAVWLGAAWTVGLAVTTEPEDREVDLVVCGPDGVDTHAPTADRVPVVALSLLPLGGRFSEALPTGVVDYGAVVLGQPDAFVPLDPPEPGDAAWAGTGAVSQQDLLTEARSAPGVGARLLTDANPCSAEGRVTLLAPLLSGGGTVWVRNPDQTRWEQRYADERAAAELRA